MPNAEPPGDDRAAADPDEDSAAEYCTTEPHASRVSERRRRRRPTYPEPPKTDRQLDAVVATAAHLTALDLPPLFRLPTIRALWRREPNRALAMELARYRGVLP